MVSYLEKAKHIAEHIGQSDPAGVSLDLGTPRACLCDFYTVSLLGIGGHPTIDQRLYWNHLGLLLVYLRLVRGWPTFGT